MDMNCKIINFNSFMLCVTVNNLKELRRMFYSAWLHFLDSISESHAPENCA